MPKYKALTDKQAAAQTRNWRIRRLRAYFHLCPLFGEARAKIQELIDFEIISLGAESEILREAKRLKELFDERENQSGSS